MLADLTLGDSDRELIDDERSEKFDKFLAVSFALQVWNLVEFWASRGCAAFEIFLNYLWRYYSSWMILWASEYQAPNSSLISRRGIGTGMHERIAFYERGEWEEVE